MSYEEEDTCHKDLLLRCYSQHPHSLRLIILIIIISLSLSLYLSISLSLLSLSLSHSRPLAPSLSLPLSRPPSHSRTESQTLLPPTIPLTSYRPLYLSGFSVVFSLV